MIKSGLSALYKMLAVSLGAQFALRPQGMPFRISAPPESPRYWHDPTDAKHLNRMQAAEERRELRAGKAHDCANRSYENNPCIGGCGEERFNPFFINY